MRQTALILCLLGVTGFLGGCDALGIETATQIADKKEAEARAIGSACRHALRSIEDCFGSNPKAGKAAVFAGWKDMDQYMRDNEIVGMPSSGDTSGTADEGGVRREADPNETSPKSRKS